MPNDSPEKQRAEEWIDDTKGFVNLIISLSTGALALSITFVGQILVFNFPRLLMGICWIGFIISILTGLYLHRTLLDIDIDEIKNHPEKSRQERDEFYKVYFIQMLGFAIGFFSLAVGALWALNKWWAPIFVIVMGVTWLYCKYGKPPLTANK